METTKRLPKISEEHPRSFKDYIATADNPKTSEGYQILSEILPTFHAIWDYPLNTPIRVDLL